MVFGAPDPVLLATAVLAFLAGSTAPTYFAQERLRGFGRWAVARLPYQPPPGMDPQKAMEEATENSGDGEEG